MKELGINLHALCTWHDILDVAKEEKMFDDATIRSVETFLTSPDKWAAKHQKQA
jgi:orotate phosphoribosyltransferase